MNFKLENQTYIVNCDWLSFNVKLIEPEPEIECPAGYRLEILQGNNIFKNRLILRDDTGAKIITCLWCPYSKVIDKLTMTCQIANALLYESGILRAFELLQRIVQCEFNTCSRLDFCCDFVATDRHIAIVRKLTSGAMYVTGKREGSEFWHNTKYKGHDAKFSHCLSWGAKSSEIKVKLYFKSREQNLLQPEGIPDKPYIVAQWQEMSLDIKKVWRLEFSISGAGLLRYRGKLITLEDVSSPQWYCGVFADLYKKRFEVRKNQGKRKGKHNDDAIVDFFPKEFVRMLGETELVWKETEKNRLPDADVVTSLRKLLKLLEEPAATSSEDVFDSIAASICTLVEVAHLQLYCERLLGKPVEQYMNELRNEVGFGVHELTPAPSKFWL